jgi:hypothetical protein
VADGKFIARLLNMTQIVKTGASCEFLGRDNGETKMVPFGCDVSNVGMLKKARSL